MNAVELKNVSKNYYGFSIKNISFALPQGTVMGLVGENGAGKTTLFKLILGMAKKDGGEITLYGDEIKNLPKENIGVVFDECKFNGEFNADWVNTMLKNIYYNWNEQLYFDYLDKFGIIPIQRIKEYSRGMKMKLSIAAALSHNAKLLILDEPTSGLDPVVRDEILDVFYDFTSNGENSIIISSHIVSDLEKICDYIGFMKKGELPVFAPKDELLDEYRLVKADESIINSIPADALLGRRKTDFGVEAAVRRCELPQGIEPLPVSLEELFILFSSGRNAK